MSFSFDNCDDASLVMSLYTPPTAPFAAGDGDGDDDGATYDTNSTFWLHPVRNINGNFYDTPPNTGSCADPFAWWCPSCNGYALACTGGDLALYHSATIGVDVAFTTTGVALGGRVPGWAASKNRWAPENLECTTNAGATVVGNITATTPTVEATATTRATTRTRQEQSLSASPAHSRVDNAAGVNNATVAVVEKPYHVMFFADATGADGKHHIGWAMSEAASSAQLASSYTEYATDTLNLGETKQGEIDAHIFRDPTDNRTYLLWKTDDNSIGLPSTRLWAVEVAVSPGNVTQLGERQVIMDSTGLWWVDSFVPGGSLVEGPELVYHAGLGYYYLFFAAGKFCHDSYSEGVARSKARSGREGGVGCGGVFGPWEKMPVPLLSTGMTGYSGGKKQVGPGHASFVHEVADVSGSGDHDDHDDHDHDDHDGDDYGRHFVVYHASLGENCDRHAFVEQLKFDSATGWPYVDFGASNDSSRRPF